VPSLRYAREAAESLMDDESWGARIRVVREAESYPVFLSNIPAGITAEQIRTQIEGSAKSKALKVLASGSKDEVSFVWFVAGLSFKYLCFCLRGPRFCIQYIVGARVVPDCVAAD
jgi:hypothetical protein